MQSPMWRAPGFGMTFMTTLTIFALNLYFSYKMLPAVIAYPIVGLFLFSIGRGLPKFLLS